MSHFSDLMAKRDAALEAKWNHIAVCTECLVTGAVERCEIGKELTIALTVVETEIDDFAGGNMENKAWLRRNLRTH